MESDSGLHPRTRRTIVWSLAVISLACIAAQVALGLLSAAPASDAMMAVASACVGAIGGMAVPPTPPGD
jgi:hypothetical protein